MEADARVAVDQPALGAVVDALARAGRMAEAAAQTQRAAELCHRQGAAQLRAAVCKADVLLQGPACS